MTSREVETRTEAVEATFAEALESHIEAESLGVVASSPLPAGFNIGSHFGHRTSNRTGLRTFHAGVDFTAPRGTPVYAVRAGVVEHVATDRDGRGFGGYGNAVVVHHPDLDRWTFYAHLSEVDVSPGDHVAPGQRLGAVGNTSNGRFRIASHLHFEVRHATRDGGSPFPGAYRRHNEDPGAWLASLGVRFEHDDDCMAADGVEDERAPVLVLGERAEPTLVADARVGVATF